LAEVKGVLSKMKKELCWNQSSYFLLHLLLLFALFLLSEGEHGTNKVLYGGRQQQEHEGSGVEKQKGYYEHVDLSDNSNKSQTSLSTNSDVQLVKHDQGRTQLWRTGSCFSCTTLSEKDQLDPGNICYNISLYKQWSENNRDDPRYTQKCSHEQKYCQVKRVDYKVDNMEGYAQWSLTRSCETECRPFCVTMGGRTKVTYCTSCCRWDGSTWDPRTKTLKPGPRSDYCNVGNAANVRKVVFTSWLATTLPIMVFAILASHF